MWQLPRTATSDGTSEPKRFFKCFQLREVRRVGQGRASCRWLGKMQSNVVVEDQNAAFLLLKKVITRQSTGWVCPFFYLQSCWLAQQQRPQSRTLSVEYLQLNKEMWCSSTYKDFQKLEDTLIRGRWNGGNHLFDLHSCSLFCCAT